jgi:hypothetical protein
MDTDILFVLGLFLSVMSVPAIVSAWSDGRVPRVASVVLLLGGGLMLWANSLKVGGYAFDDIPHLIVQVVGRFI